MSSVLRAVGRIITVLAVQIVVAVGLLEIAGRAFDPLGVSYYPETARYLDTLVLEEPIGYRNLPGLEGRYYSAPVRINSFGMRDREVAPKPVGEFRVLVLGDSVPFGIGVRYEDSIPHQLERILGERHPGRRFRTLNMGVPSYNTEQELIQLRTLGLGLKPDVALLIFSANDIEPKLWVLEKRKRWYVDLAQRSYAASLLYYFVRELRARFGSMPTTGTVAGPDTPLVNSASGTVPAGGTVAGPDAPLANSSPGTIPTTGTIAGLDAPLVNFAEYRIDSPRWLAIDRSLTEINRLLREGGVRFVLFALGEAPPALDLLQGVASREGFPFFNLKRHEDPRWRGMDERLFHNSTIDGHPSALGNAALGAMIAEALAREGVVGRFK